MFIRVAFGIVFIVSGAGKIFGIGPKSADGIGGFAEFLAQLDVMAPELFEWLVGLVELVGGLFNLVGLFTCYVVALLAIDMVMATLLVHIPNGFSVSNDGYESPLVLAMIAIALVLSGPGTLSLERTIFDHERLPMGRKPETTEERTKT